MAFTRSFLIAFSCLCSRLVSFRDMNGFPDSKEVVLFPMDECRPNDEQPGGWKEELR